MAHVPSIIPIPQTSSGSDLLDGNSADEQTYCWLDCDPGHDDAMAIILALYSEKIKLLGISTIAGNQSIEKTTTNALQVLNICGQISPNKPTAKQQEQLNLKDCLTHGGLSVPVLQGKSRPLIRPSRICDEIHGESGLEGTKFPKIPDHALDYTHKLTQHPKHFTTQIYEAFKSAPQLVTLITIGPMTNIALLLLNYPDVTKYISKIVLMGGGVGVGNTGAAAEFNMQVDPDAAHIVFDTANIPIYMIPLEVTHTVIVTPQVQQRIESLKTNFSHTVVQLLSFFKTSYKEVFGFDYPPLHDPTAIAFIIDPSLFTYRLMRVDIETHSELSYGQTVCDIYDMSKKRKNVHVCLKIDVDKFWDLMLDALQKANQKSPIN